MGKDITICFQTTSEISNTLNKVAEDEKLSVSEVVDNIINRHLKYYDEFSWIKHNRRRFERKKASLPAYIGDARWQRHDFKVITIMDISLSGIKFAVPKETKLKIHKNSDKEKFIVIFRLPNYYWPVNVQIAPQRVYESDEAVQIGATLVNPDFHTYSALQKYMN